MFCILTACGFLTLSFLPTFTHRTKKGSKIWPKWKPNLVVKATSSIEKKNDETQEESWMQYKIEYIALWKKRKEKERKWNEMNQTESNRIDVESNQRERYIYMCVSKCGLLGWFIRDWNNLSSKKSRSSRF